MFWMTARLLMSTKASTAALVQIVALKGRKTVNLNRFVSSQRRVPRHAAGGLTNQVSSPIALRLDTLAVVEALCNPLERP
jgi:hypothetical protein